MFSDKFNNGVAWTKGCGNSFKMLRTKDWLKLQAQDSSFYILVIQDHIESIGKPILSRRDEVLLNEPLASSA